MRELGAKLGKSHAALNGDARDLLLRHRWPGNIRELQNAVERALIVSDGGLITAGQLGITVTDDAVTPPPSVAVAASGLGLADASTAGAEPLADLERRAIVDALTRMSGNKSRAAAMLGLTRTQLYTRLKRFHLAG